MSSISHDRSIAADDVIGVVGLGASGGPIARRLLDSGFKVNVYDIRIEALQALVEVGASASSSVGHLAGQARVILVIVENDDQVESVVTEILEKATPDTVIVVHSIVSPENIRRIGNDAAKRGVELIDAPISGGGPKARNGMLTVLLGGDEESVNYCWPLFEAIGKHLFRVGPVGSGQAMALINNILSLGNLALLIEVMKFADAFGVDEDTVATVASTGQGDSRRLRSWGRNDRVMREHTHAGTDAIYPRVAKDIVKADAVARGLGLDLPLIAMTARLLPDLLKSRESELASRPQLDPIPLCRLCDEELAPPFRAVGVHPECEFA